jgi:hypothetical protein
MHERTFGIDARQAQRGEGRVHRGTVNGIMSVSFGMFVKKDKFA